MHRLLLWASGLHPTEDPLRYNEGDQTSPLDQTDPVFALKAPPTGNPLSPSQTRMDGPWHHGECAPKGGEVGVFVITGSSVVEVRSRQHTPEHAAAGKLRRGPGVCGSKHQYGQLLGPVISVYVKRFHCPWNSARLG